MDTSFALIFYIDELMSLFGNIVHTHTDTHTHNIKYLKQKSQ